MAHGAPSSSITNKWSYDVFLSFDGGDPSFRGFIRHLHQSLIHRELSVFPDYKVIRMGGEITSAIVEDIHKSRISIIVFSKNYANSARCLQELVQILKCSNEEGRSIYTVLYDVDPSEVHQQTGLYAEVLSQAAALPGCQCMLDWNRLHGMQPIDPFSDLIKDLTMKLNECVGAIIEQVTVWINKQKEEEEEKEHDDTNYETTDLSFWEKKERIGSYDVLLSYHEGIELNFPRGLRDSLREGGLGVQYIHVTNWISQYKQRTRTFSEAIQKSRIAIIIFSKNYANSAYRVEELDQILKCFKGKGLIHPVFYDVDPSEALARLENRFKYKRAPVDQEWRQALSPPADLPGYHFLPRTMNADDCIRAIVERVTAWMNEKEKYWVWDKGEEIGCGAHGNVYVAHHWKTRAICGAVKELNIYQADAAYQYIRKEIKFLSKLKEHPNIVKYYDNKDEGGRISLYMEHIQPGSLKKYISKRGKLKERIVQNFTAQILFGLVHLHSNRQVHRDLKPDNLLVDSKDSKDIVKLVDFGLAKLLQLDESDGKHSVGGTRLYAALEVRLGENYERSREALAADIWSLGCVIVEMSSGLPPNFIDSNSDSNLQRPRIPEELCEEGIDFLEHCFKRKPADRPSAEELLKHPFVKAEADALMEESTIIDGVGTC